jgi:hypothetical protein
MLARRCLVGEWILELNNKKEVPEKINAMAVAGFMENHNEEGR